MMKKLRKLTMVMFLFSILIKNSNIVLVTAEAPYNTYTSDSYYGIIQSPEAYTPVEQISIINGEKLEMPEHVYVDANDYLYVTDSDKNKVYILDDKYRFYKELTSDVFSSIKSTFVTNEYIYVVDGFECKIFIFDKKTHQFVKEIGEPDSPIFKEGYKFNPTHIAVDIRGNIYVRSTGSVNGFLMLNKDGEFLTFFGANPLKVPLADKVRAFFLTEKQEEKMKKVFPDVPSDIDIDKKGFIYSVTSSIKTNPIKKFNVSGKNYFSDHLISLYGMESIWVGHHNNVYSVCTDGWIFEYDTSGNLLFIFGGKDFSSSRLGLLNRPISIASNSRSDLIVVDQGNKLLQTYRITEFAQAVHSAMDAYQKGDYSKSKELWEYTLKYNSIFDIAHIGLGDAYLQEDNYEAALREYKYAQHNEGISKAYWEIRQTWLEENLDMVFGILLVVLILRYAYKLFNKKYSNKAKIQNRIRVKNRIIDDLLYIITFLKHPLNGFYDLKTENRVSKRSSTIIYALLGAVFIFHKKYTNILFVNKEGVNIAYELTIIAILLTLWIVSNYLICSINDGEGSLTNAYNATAYSLTPILVIMPPLIVISRYLTLEQSVFYYLPMQIMLVWIIFLMFFMIKDIHNFEVGETNSVILKSFFTMLIIGLFIFIFYSLGNQLFDFLFEVVTEAINR